MTHSRLPLRIPQRGCFKPITGKRMQLPRPAEPEFTHHTGWRQVRQEGRKAFLAPWKITNSEQDRCRRETWSPSRWPCITPAAHKPHSVQGRRDHERECGHGLRNTRVPYLGTCSSASLRDMDTSVFPRARHELRPPRPGGLNTHTARPGQGQQGLGRRAPALPSVLSLLLLPLQVEPLVGAICLLDTKPGRGGQRLELDGRRKISSWPPKERFTVQSLLLCTSPRSQPRGLTRKEASTTLLGQ